jgi:hypothetical protein
VPKISEKWLGIAAGAFVVAALAAQVASARASTLSQAAATAKVTICHFGGHVGDAVAKPNGSCAGAGGNEITVALKACSSGHGISATACAKTGDEEEKSDPGN